MVFEGDHSVVMSVIECNFIYGIKPLVHFVGDKLIHALQLDRGGMGQAINPC